MAIYTNEPQTNEDLKDIKELKYYGNVVIGDIAGDRTKLKHIRIYQVPQRYHSTGFRMNDHYTLTEPKVDIENLRAVEDVHNGCWRIDCRQINYWYNGTIQSGTITDIYLNDDKVFSFSITGFEAAMVKAQNYIYQLDNILKDILDTSVDKPWRESIRGMKIWFGPYPAIIDHALSNGSYLILKPDGDVPHFGRMSWDFDESPEEYDKNFEGSIKVSILSPHIRWFRD